MREQARGARPARALRARPRRVPRRRRRDHACVRLRDDRRGEPIDVGHAMITLYVFARADAGAGRSSRGRTRWRPERRRTGDWTFAARSGRVARCGSRSSFPPSSPCSSSAAAPAGAESVYAGRDGLISFFRSNENLGQRAHRLVSPEGRRRRCRSRPTSAAARSRARPSGSRSRRRAPLRLRRGERDAAGAARHRRRRPAAARTRSRPPATSRARRAARTSPGGSAARVLARRAPARRLDLRSATGRPDDTVVLTLDLLVDDPPDPVPAPHVLASGAAVSIWDGNRILATRPTGPDSTVTVAFDADTYQALGQVAGTAVRHRGPKGELIGTTFDPGTFVTSTHGRQQRAPPTSSASTPARRSTTAPRWRCPPTASPRRWRCPEVEQVIDALPAPSGKGYAVLVMRWDNRHRSFMRIELHDENRQFVRVLAPEETTFTYYELQNWSAKPLPVVFVPGFLGSEITCDGTADGAELWPALPGPAVRALPPAGRRPVRRDRPGPLPVRRPERAARDRARQAHLQRRGELAARHGRRRRVVPGLGLAQAPAGVDRPPRRDDRRRAGAGGHRPGAADRPQLRRAARAPVCRLAGAAGEARARDHARHALLGRREVLVPARLRRGDDRRRRPGPGARAGRAAAVRAQPRRPLPPVAVLQLRPVAEHRLGDGRGRRDRLADRGVRRAAGPARAGPLAARLDAGHVRRHRDSRLDGADRHGHADAGEPHAVARHRRGPRGADRLRRRRRHRAGALVLARDDPRRRPDAGRAAAGREGVRSRPRAAPQRRRGPGAAAAVGRTPARRSPPTTSRARRSAGTCSIEGVDLPAPRAHAFRLAAAAPPGGRASPTSSAAVPSTCSASATTSTSSSRPAR